MLRTERCTLTRRHPPTLHVLRPWGHGTGLEKILERLCVRPSHLLELLRVGTVLPAGDGAVNRDTPVAAVTELTFPCRDTQ